MPLTLIKIFIDYIQGIIDSDEGKAVILTFFVSGILFLTFQSYKYYEKRKYNHIKEMSLRILKKSYKKKLDWTCHGGMKHGLAKELEPLITDMKKAYYNNDWEHVKLIVLEIYNKSECPPLPPQTFPIKRWWINRKIKKDHYTTCRAISLRFYEMFALVSVSVKEKIDYETLRKINIPAPVYDQPKEYWERKQELIKKTYNLLKKLIINRKIIPELSQKYESMYQKVKETYQHHISRKLSFGYELESPEISDTFSHKQFFKYNKTFSIACNNFLRNSEDEIDFDLSNWRL